MEIGQVLTVIAGVVTAIGGLGYLLDRRAARQSEIWRGIAEARAAENHDCNERLTRVEADLRVMREGWVTGAITTISAGVVGTVADEVSRRRQWERREARRAEEGRRE